MSHTAGIGTFFNKGADLLLKTAGTRIIERSPGFELFPSGPH